LSLVANLLDTRVLLDRSEDWAEFLVTDRGNKFVVRFRELNGRWYLEAL
jgi:hypothetical protein